MMKRVKIFWFIMVSVLAADTLLVASCGGDSDDKPSDEDGYSSGTSGGSSGTSGGSSGKSGGMDAATIDGATFEPVSTGTVEAEGACTGTPSGIASLLGSVLEGTCKPSETECPGGGATSSDCAEGLVCCIGTDQCEALPETMPSGMFSSFVEDLSCVPEGSCNGSPFGDQSPFSIELPFGCPAGQICCPRFPEGGMPFFEGGIPFLEGGVFEGGTSSRDAGTSTPTGDDATTPTVDAGEQTVDAGE